MSHVWFPGVVTLSPADTLACIHQISVTPGPGILVNIIINISSNSNRATELELA